MKQLFYGALLLLALAGCNKDGQIKSREKVEIYLLKSFNIAVDQSTIPYTTTVADAVLEDVPIVPDDNIAYYSKANTTFKLKTDIKPIIKNYGSDMAFAVTVNRQIVYAGRFHPAFLSSITYGMATIDPVLFYNKELKINFVFIDGISTQKQLDKRNDEMLLNALSASRRLR